MKPSTASFGWIALVFSLLCAPLIWSSNEGGYAADETDFHLPAVRQIRSHWPQLDLERDALSAISPGYHYVLATVSFLTGTDRVPLRIVTWILSLAVLGWLWRAFPPATPLATAALLPLACSNFFIKSASWIVTDNPGLLCVVAVLTTSFLRQPGERLWQGGVLAAAATFIRQLHVWTTFPVAWQAVQKMRTAPSVGTRCLAALPPLLPLGVLAVLAWHWGGLVPPQWAVISYAEQRASTAALCYLGAVFGIFGTFYFLAMPAGSILADFRRLSAIAGAVVGLALALGGPTNHDMSAGRWGGYLWAIAARLPTFEDRSLLFILLTPLGGALLAVMTARLARAAGGTLAFLWLGSYLAWASTFLPNRLVFHRYYEPMTLVFLVLWMALMFRASATPPRLSRLYLLGAVQVSLTLATAHYQTLVLTPPS